jgi:hypothetical protein
MESKERCTDLLDMRLEPPALRVQLATSQAQARRCVRCRGVNRGALVGLLLPYPIEGKEPWM